MTPEESQRLEACIQEAAAILYRNTPKNELTSLESIEKTVRQQILQHISPKICRVTFFIGQVTGTQQGRSSEAEKLFWGTVD